MFETSIPDGPKIIGNSLPPERVSTRLPPEALQKLVHLQMVRDDIRDGLDAAQAKLTDMRRPDNALSVALQELNLMEQTDIGAVFQQAFRTQGTPPEKQSAEYERYKVRYEAVVVRVEHLRAEVEKVRATVEERGQNWQNAEKLVVNILRWLAVGSDPLVMAEFAAPKLSKNQSADDEIEKLRGLLTALKAEHKRVGKAAIPATEAKLRAKSWVAGRAARVRLHGFVNRNGSPDIGLPEQEAALALACWLQPETVLRRLEKEIDERVNDRVTLTELEQARELKKLNDKIMDAERREEALIVQLADDGKVVARRFNAEPRAVLGVE